jgi:hypothetical protein
MKRLHLTLPAAAVLGLALLSSPSPAAPATSLPGLAPLTADEAGAVEQARYSRGWRCVKKGRCWVPCQGDRCRRACFRSWWSCRRSI